MLSIRFQDKRRNYPCFGTNKPGETWDNTIISFPSLFCSFLYQNVEIDSQGRNYGRGGALGQSPKGRTVGSMDKPIRASAGISVKMVRVCQHPYGYPRPVNFGLDIHMDIRADIRVELSVQQTVQLEVGSRTQGPLKEWQLSEIIPKREAGINCPRKNG